VDSSALVKLVVEEPESAALLELFGRDPVQVASALVEVEVVRAVRRSVPSLLPQAERVVSQIAVIDVSDTIRARARLLDPVTLRSLDALHLATALQVGDDLDAVVTYDSRMAEAGRIVGLRVVSPA
jgi:predicted nucleic acid-binding protein